MRDQASKYIKHQPRFIVILMLLLAGLPKPGQAVQAVPISYPVETIVEKIISINEIMNHAVGYSGRRPQQWDNFIELSNTASTGELLTLTKHNKGVVRCYALWALTKRDHVDLFSLALDHINDNEEVKYLYADQGGVLLVGDFYVDKVWSALTPQQQEKLNHTLLTTENKLLATTYLLREIEPSEEWYPRVRLLAQQGNPDALVLLSKYKRDQDVGVILGQYNTIIKKNWSLFYIYRSASHFPHPELFPVLQHGFSQALSESFPSNETRELYLAIASYKNEAAAGLLNRIFGKANSSISRDGHLLALYDAAETYRNPLYDEILWKLWVEHFYITQEVIEYLYPKDQERATRAIKASLSESYLLYFGGLGATIPDMLHRLLATDRDAAIEIMHQNILTAHVHIFRPFARVAAEIKDRKLITPLFSRIETDTNMHIYTASGLALLLYDDPQINERLGKYQKLGPDFVQGWRDAGIERINSYLEQ